MSVYARECQYEKQSRATIYRREFFVVPSNLDSITISTCSFYFSYHYSFKINIVTDQLLHDSISNTFLNRGSMNRAAVCSTLRTPAASSFRGSEARGHSDRRQFSSSCERTPVSVEVRGCTHGSKQTEGRIARRKQVLYTYTMHT